MFSTIMTWIGAMLGVTILLATAVGAFALDLFDEKRERSAPRETEPTAPQGH
ncbi:MULTISPECIES: hypothetical protein [Amycolatopsis]|uniref:Uncharacterized protein n=1 Tax=Amycolatopsis minnesotensis TaxID=337894 RepID=A0ABP5BVC6_9PSEU|nr:hypothetical protein [Amycolatopsis sp. CA-230715]QWF80254.1 hypothetical protein HUW46_03673 [Amycolatopsis sp. CA-230715]